MQAESDSLGAAGYTGSYWSLHAAQSGTCSCSAVALEEWGMVGTERSSYWEEYYC